MNQRFPENPNKPSAPRKPSAQKPENAPAKPNAPTSGLKQKIAAFEQNGLIKFNGAQRTVAPQIVPPPRPQREQSAPANSEIYANIPQEQQAPAVTEKLAPIDYEIYGNIPPRDQSVADGTPAKNGPASPKGPDIATGGSRPTRPVNDGPPSRKAPQPKQFVKQGPAVEAQAVMFKIPDLSRPLDQQDHRPAVKQPISYTVSRGPGDSPYVNVSALLSKANGKPAVQRERGPAKSAYGDSSAVRVDIAQNANPNVDQIADKNVKVEKEVQRGQTASKQMTLPADGDIATGKFIVGANSNWIQKSEQHGLIHYNADDLSESAKNAIHASMKADQPLTVSTRDKQLSVAPARKH